MPLRIKMTTFTKWYYSRHSYSIKNVAFFSGKSTALQRAILSPLTLSLEFKRNAIAIQLNMLSICWFRTPSNIFCEANLLLASFPFVVAQIMCNIIVYYSRYFFVDGTLVRCSTYWESECFIVMVKDSLI